MPDPGSSPGQALISLPRNVVSRGIHNLLNLLDSGFCRNDEKTEKMTFYEAVNNDMINKFGIAE
jgi:hypothetical protein